MEPLGKPPPAQSFCAGSGSYALETKLSFVSLTSVSLLLFFLLPISLSLSLSLFFFNHTLDFSF